MLWKNISTFKYFIKHINNTVKNEAPKNVENGPSKTTTENKSLNEATKTTTENGPISGAPQISKEN